MDPDAALNYIRELAEEDPDSDIAMAFESLDNWLLGGGFLPHDWKAAKKGWSCPT